MPIIEFKNIYLKFDEQIILHDFSFSIEDKEKILITGASGSGKTSLIRLILGFIKCDKGEIFYNNKICSPESFMELRQKTAFIPQDTDFAEGRVSDFLQKMQDLKANKDKAKRDMQSLINKLMLCPTIIDKNIEELSGGEKQRLALLSGLMIEKEIFLLDEPTSALDKKAKEKVISLVSELDATVIVVAHDREWLDFNYDKHYKLEQETV